MRRNFQRRYISFEESEYIRIHPDTKETLILSYVKESIYVHARYITHAKLAKVFAKREKTCEKAARVGKTFKVTRYKVEGREKRCGERKLCSGVAV